jgi:hypothetical protein
MSYSRRQLEAFGEPFGDPKLEVVVFMAAVEVVAVAKQVPK